MEKKDFAAGIKKMIPVLLSYVPLGLAAGMLLSEAGFHPVGIGLMSLLVFAGAGQFMAASMVSAGASVVSIIAMVFFLNLRHLLLSSSMSEYLRGKKLPFLLLFSHTLVDESYAMNYTEFSMNPFWTTQNALAANLSGLTVWVCSTILGGLLGQFIPINALLVNYVLIAMFICMMVMQWGTKVHIVVSLVTGILSVLLLHLLKHNIALVIAALIGSFVGYYFDKQGQVNRFSSKRNKEVRHADK